MQLIASNALHGETETEPGEVCGDHEESVGFHMRPVRSVRGSLSKPPKEGSNNSYASASGYHT